MAEHVLDNPAWFALNGPQAGFAETHGPFRRYRSDVTPFGGTGSAADREHLADHLPAGALVAFWTLEPFAAPRGIEAVGGGLGLQMVAQTFRPSPATIDMRPLGVADVPAMLELVKLTQPGPFLPRTNTLGSYLGVFDGDRLVAMTGERMKPPGYTEISAVCTHPDYRGRGLAKALITATASAVIERGETPMLHVVAGNRAAIAVYEALGFAARRTLQVTVLQHAGGAAYEEPEYLRKH
jgi:ribosomal protein S18 acetylase RimI-like enzyme